MLELCSHANQQVVVLAQSVLKRPEWAHVVKTYKAEGDAKSEVESNGDHTIAGAPPPPQTLASSHQPTLSVLPPQKSPIAAGSDI